MRNKVKIHIFVLIVVLCLGSMQAALAEQCQEVIYQIIVDRFFDGDNKNNNPAQSAGLFSATHNSGSKANWKGYWGGDFAGIESKLDYLKDMGVTALWLSPVVDNINKSVVSESEGTATGFHGYWARDFTRLEEHFSDAQQSWKSFDSLVDKAHRKGIKIYVDFAPNHSSPRKGGTDAAMYEHNLLLGKYSSDSKDYFHKNATLNGSDFSDRYKVQFYSLADLADLNQQNSEIDDYLKRSFKLLQQHGVDGFRLDTLKHTDWGWQYSLASALNRNAKGRCTIFGEWWIDNGNHDPLYGDAVKFCRRSGINLLNFPLNSAITDTFARYGSFRELDKTLSYENKDFSFPQDLVNFVDNHDRPRFLNIKSDHDRLDLALGFLLTAPGIPCIYYGTEQYLHNNGDGGNDPYNRPMMTAFDTNTTAYRIISRLSLLRQKNPAIAYGSTKELWLNDDVYVFRRRYGSNVLVTAINKSNNASPTISDLGTALPPGVYNDELDGLKGGQQLRVLNNGSALQFVLPPKSMSVWSFIQPAPNLPQVTASRPRLAQRGEPITFFGRGFGNSAGPVTVNGNPLSVSSWNDEEIAATVDSSISTGNTTFVINTADGASVEKAVEVVNNNLVTVTFTVKNVPPTEIGDEIYLSGDCFELGDWKTDKRVAYGPLMNPNYPSWFTTAAVPAATRLQFKFIRFNK
ncbi:MAG: alpha amylase C-terminal domain-containing protein, partial [Cyanobacteria bacterium]|nr:alpha amylase C-terminal domain-containing protein [Cyanobacteriota bacterium]